MVTSLAGMVLSISKVYTGVLNMILKMKVSTGMNKKMKLSLSLENHQVSVGPRRRN